MGDTNRWKDSLLKSSLPLEHVVSEQLESDGWEVWGQYSYSRRNESGIDTEFSVDLHAGIEFSTKSHWLSGLDLLIECKYSSPGVNWIFLPYPISTTLLSGVVKIFDQCANKRVTRRAAFEHFEEDIPYCVRGISLFDSGFDENSIQRGAAQLRFAMPRVAEDTFSSHITDAHDEDIAVRFACAILVTTAPLFCLKRGLRLDDLFAAKELSSVVEPVEELIMWEWGAPDRNKYSRGLFAALDSEALNERLNQYRSVFVPTKQVKYPPDESSVRSGVLGAGDHVLVTTLARLPTVLRALKRGAKESAGSLHRIAQVARDPQSGEALISAVVGDPKLGRPRAK
jgi:hypothetical protein